MVTQRQQPVPHIVHGGGIAGMLKRLTGLSHKAVYVGIPQDRSSRGGEEINNASLLYIHTHGIRRRSMIRAMQKNMNRGMKYSQAYALYIMSHGSPLWHSPPRPVIEPAIAANKDKIARQYAKVLKATAKGDDAAVNSALMRTGLAGQNAARAWFRNPANGWPPNSPKTIAKKGSSRPLIDTGTLRKAITYVIKDE